jgi:hypothetical protein
LLTWLYFLWDHVPVSRCPGQRGSFITAFQRGSEITAAEPWQDGTRRPYGVRVKFNTGTVLNVSITAVTPPGEDFKQPEQPLTGAPPAEVPVPEPYDGGKVTPLRAEAYLAALLNNTGNPEMARAYAYSARETPPMNPGLGVDFHNGGKAHMLIDA